MPPQTLSPDRRPVVAGVALTEVGKVYDTDSPRLAARAVRLAAADAGIDLAAIDGLIVSSGLGTPVTTALQQQLGLEDLRLLTQMQAFGSTAVQMVQYAALAIASGMAQTVAIAWADDPLSPARRSGTAYGARRRGPQSGWRAISQAAGISGPNQLYALAARRHMSRYGTTSADFGSIAVAQRAWAGLNPIAQMRDPITLDDHANSRMIADPLHLLDCCLVSNGGAALILTSAARAEHLPQAAVSVLGWGQSHPGRTRARNDDFGLVTGATVSGPAALRMADVTVDDVDCVQLYDCYTYTVLVTLEDYGFCAKGEGGAFVSEPGRLGPRGSLPLNTGGGELSGFYLWGMTPLVEGVLQARGSAEERQVPQCETVLVSGNGGTLDHHSTLVLGRRD